MRSNVTIRRANEADAFEIGEVFIEARAEMAYLPDLHTEDETCAFVAGVLAREQVWAAVLGRRVIGFAALQGEWLNHLYVHPDYQNGETGTALLRMVRVLRPAGFQFWVFQENAGARRFYERHGCKAAEFTDGSGNEEKLPDIRYEWRPARAD